MARLNEPPIVAASGTNTETVEAGQLFEAPAEPTILGRMKFTDVGDYLVKRRFLRQNRELAKYVY